MFDIGFSELILIGLVALIVIGPEKLPKVARTVGHLLGKAQRYVNDVKSEINREMELDELRKFKSEMEDSAQKMKGEMQTTLRDAEKDMNDAVATVEKNVNAAVEKTDAAESSPSSKVESDEEDSPKKVNVSSDARPAQ